MHGTNVVWAVVLPDEPGALRSRVGGIAPDVPVEAAPEAFTNSEDPVLRGALEHLRQQHEAERKPGKRGTG